MANTAGGNYTSPQFEQFCTWLLQADYPPTMTTTQLSSALGLPKDTINGWVRKGFLDTFQDPHDGRGTIHVILRDAY